MDALNGWLVDVTALVGWLRPALQFTLSDLPCGKAKIRSGGWPGRLKTHLGWVA